MDIGLGLDKIGMINYPHTSLTSIVQQSIAYCQIQLAGLGIPAILEAVLSGAIGKSW